MPITPRLLIVIAAVALLGSACGGDDAEDQLADSATTETPAVEAATPTPEAPDSLPVPTLVPLDEIDIAGLGPVIDGEADDEFNRCSLFTPENLSGLLGEMWSFGEGQHPSTIACSWSDGEGEDLGFVLIAMGAIEGEFDPRLGDSAAGSVPVPEIEIGDEFFDITGSTYGPGVAFRQGDVGVQIHVIWGTPNTTSRIAVEREAEIRIAENLSFRLPDAS
jgi:hypothetical protein